MQQSVRAYLDAYREAMRDSPAYPAREDDAARLIELASVEKLLYEVRYELANRPSWLPGPLGDLLNRVRDQ